MDVNPQTKVIAVISAPYLLVKHGGWNTTFDNPKNEKYVEFVVARSNQEMWNWLFYSSGTGPKNPITSATRPDWSISVTSKPDITSSPFW